MTNTGEEGISSEGRKEFQARGGRNLGISSEGRKEFQARGGRNFKCEVNPKLSEHFDRMSKRETMYILESCVLDARPDGVCSSILWLFSKTKDI